MAKEASVRKILAVFAAVISTLGLMLFSSGNASAAGEWLGCRIAPGNELNFRSPCYTSAAPDQNGYYYVAFMVQNETTSSTYAWTRSSHRVYTGCASTTNWCTLLVKAIAEYAIPVSMSVTLTQGRYTQTLGATAHVGGGCYSGCA